MKHSIKSITIGGIIAAIYLVLTVMQNVILPSSAGGVIQFRISEAMCVLALFSPYAVSGLTVGCLAANIFAGLGTIDLIFGPAATFLATLLMYKCRNIKCRSLPLLALIMPAPVNGLLIGAEIAAFFSEGVSFLPMFLFSFTTVFIGEIAVLLLLGTPLYYAIERNSNFKNLIK